MSNENSKKLSVPSTPGAMPLRATHLAGPRGFHWREPKQMWMLRDIYTDSELQKDHAEIESWCRARTLTTIVPTSMSRTLLPLVASCRFPDALQ